MVWGAIAGGKKSKLVFMKKGMGTSADFINQVYEPVLLDFYKCLDSPVFMEDDAPKLHYSRIDDNVKIKDLALVRKIVCH